MRGVGINKMFSLNAADAVADETNRIDEIGKWKTLAPGIAAITIAGGRNNRSKIKVGHGLGQGNFGKLPAFCG